MKETKPVEMAVYMITEYYKKNYQPFFDMVTDDVLWFGPRKDQIVRGKEGLIAGLEAAPEGMSYALGNIDVYSVPLNSGSCEVMLEYDVYTYFKSGEIHIHHQLLHTSFFRKAVKNEDGSRSYEYKARLVHVSNSLSMDAFGIGTDETSESGKDAIQILSPMAGGSRMVLSGENRRTLYLAANDVVYIESADQGHHSRIYTTSTSIRCMEKVSGIAEKYPDDLLRIHSSYLVNPAFVHQIKRFSVVLLNGMALPVPEKKYTSVKKALEERMKDM